MASRKKLRKRFFNGEVSLTDLNEDEAKYLNKYIKKMTRDIQDGKDSGVTTFKEVPCQRWAGKTVLVPVDAKIVKGEDGLLYYSEVEDKNLIVSLQWHAKEKARKAVKSRANRDEKEKAVTELKPTKLGEE